MVDINLRDNTGQVIEKASGEAQWEYWAGVLSSTEDWLQKKHWNGWRAWRSAYMFARGKQWGATEQPNSDIPDSAALDGSVTINKVGSFIQDLLPFMIRREPKFIGKPQRSQDVESAKAQGQVLSKFWTQNKMNRQLKLCALDALTIGHCIAKTGFRRELDESKARTKKGQLAAPEGFEYRDYVVKETPYFYRINPFRFLIDPAAPSYDLQSARWVAEIVYRPYQDVIEDTRYDKETIKEIRSGKPCTVRDFESERDLSEVEVSPQESEQEIDTKNDYLVLYEVWDKRSRKNFVFARGITRPLLERDWPFKHLQGFPYVMAKFEEVSNELYGLGIVSKVSDIQKMLNRARSRQYAMARAYSPQMYGPPMDETEMAKLRNKDPDDYIQLDETSAQYDLRAVPHPILPSDFYQMEASLQQDFRELTSMDTLIQGGPLPARTSATEVRARQQLFGMKLEDAIQSLDNFVLEIGEQLIAHTKAYLTSDVWVERLGKQGTQYVPVGPDQIKTSVDLELISTNKQPTDPQTDRQQAMQLLQIVSQAVPALFQVHGMQAQAIQQGMLPAPGLVDVAALLYHVAEKFEIDEIDRIIPGLSMEPVAGAEFAEYKGPRPYMATPPGQPAAGQPGAGGNDPEASQTQREAQAGGPASSFSNALGPGSIPAPQEVL